MGWPDPFSHLTDCGKAVSSTLFFIFGRWMPSFQMSGSKRNRVLTPQPLFHICGAAIRYCSVTGARDQCCTPPEPKMRQVMTMPLPPAPSMASSSPSIVPSPWRMQRNSSASQVKSQSLAPTTGSAWAYFRAEGWGFSPSGMSLRR